MPPSDRFEGTDMPPSPPRLRSTGLPEDTGGQAVEPEPFLSGHPILPEDMDFADLTQAQLYEMNQRLLEESMESERPLISRPGKISDLQKEYSNAPNFLAQIATLTRQGYSVIIRAKGDGDCFYRALAFAYLDRLMGSPGHNKEDQLSMTMNMLARADFDDGVYGQPYEILHSLIQVDGISYRDAKERLWQSFMDPMTSNYIVMYMRLLTSAQMRLDSQIAAFLIDPESQMQIPVDNFCRRFVEPLGKEADHVQVAALAQALNVYVKVAYLDGHAADGTVNFHEFAEGKGGPEPLVLLYRPGHYDILQKSA